MSSSKRSQPTFSKETQEMLKLMMKESHITNQQRRELNQAVKSGNSLPAYLPSTYKKPTKKTPKQKPAPSPGSTITGYKLRTEEEIRKTGDLDREAYRGKPIPKSREIVKDELNNLMAYGVKEIPSKFKKVEREVEKPKSKYQVLTDRFEELDADVKDCEQFIKEMEMVPGGGKEIAPIKVQIAMKKKEMQDIDKQMKAIEDR